MAAVSCCPRMSKKHEISHQARGKRKKGGVKWAGEKGEREKIKNRGDGREESTKEIGGRHRSKIKRKEGKITEVKKEGRNRENSG